MTAYKIIAEPNNATVQADVSFENMPPYCVFDVRPAFRTILELKICNKHGQTV
jgi:hypothetical protein